MSRHDFVTVRVPASTANLGPGFDCLGLALDIYNTIELSLAMETTVQVSGEGQGYLPLGPKNLVVQAADRLAAQAGQQVPGWHLRQHNEIPLARGLGSSSTAIVGGLIAANDLLQAGLDRQQLLEIATEMEGHPDNVGPALYGGLTACCVEAAPGRPARSCLSRFPLMMQCLTSAGPLARWRRSWLVAGRGCLP